MLCISRSRAFTRCFFIIPSDRRRRKKPYVRDTFAELSNSEEEHDWSEVK